MLKHPLRLFVFIGSCLFFLQCQKDPPLGLIGRVFVAGVEMGNYATDSAYSIAKLWVDGQPYDLPSATRMAQAEDVFVSKNVVYVVGSEYGNNGTARAVLWRNRQPLYLSAPDVEGQAFGVYVDRGDVYVTGLICKNFVCRTVVWKNGVETLLSDDLSYPWEIVVSGGRQYVAINKIVGTLLMPAIMQGSQLLMLETLPQTEAGEASSVFVKGNDVYASGIFHPSGVGNVAALWKNGKLTVLATGNHHTAANAVTVSAQNDVWVTGCINQYFAVWKNNQLYYKGVGDYGAGNEIAILGKDVYIAGNGDVSAKGKYNVPLLWKNNVARELPTNQKSQYGIANAVFVK